MYDFIVKNLKHGHWVAVKNKNQFWKVFTPDGRLEGTIPTNGTIDISLGQGLSTSGFSKEEIENDFTEEYKIVTPAPVLLEPGTKVELIDSYKKKCKTTYEILATYGPLTVTGISAGTYFIRHVNGTNIYEVPHWAVAPVYEPEDKFKKLKVMWDKQFEDIYGDSCIEIKPWLQITTDEQLIAELEKRGRLKDKKVIE